MQLPNQAQPVDRNVSTAAFAGATEASDVVCSVVCAGCSILSGLPRTACIAAARIAGCNC